jgi:RNA polymerase sigma factor (TIGR02999 family)
MEDAGDLTALLRMARSGDRDAESGLLERVYGDLERRARVALRGDRMGFFLSPYTLVHESFERLFRGSAAVEWVDRNHFYRVAGRTMRRIITDHARKRQALIPGGTAKQVSTDAMDENPSPAPSIERTLAISQACPRLEASHSDAAAVVDLRFFCGLSIKEAAEALRVSERTVTERQRFATAYLRRLLAAGEGYGS